jgi:hypothetical protein
MPIEFGLWRIDGEGYNRLPSTKLDDESHSESMMSMRVQSVFSSQLSPS